jgi:hypothetical protein
LSIFLSPAFILTPITIFTLFVWNLFRFSTSHLQLSCTHAYCASHS